MAATKAHQPVKGQNYPPNDLDRREGSRKATKCQRCGAKSDLKDQYRVELKGEGHGSPGDPRVVKSKGARDGKSHYCSDCADTRKGELQRQLNAELNGGRGKATKAGKRSAKPAGKAKAKAKPKAKASTPKPKAKPKAKAAKKRSVSKAEPKKETAAAEADPF